MVLKIAHTSMTKATNDSLIAPEYKALKELTQAEYEELFHQAFTKARKTVHESELAEPKPMIALLAVCDAPLCYPCHGSDGVRHQESFYQGLFTPSQELVAAARERAAAEDAKTEETEEDGEDA